MYLSSLVLVLVFCGCGGAAAVQESSKPLAQSKKTPLRQWKLSGEPSVGYVGKTFSHKDSRIDAVPLVAVEGSGLSADESKDWHLIRVSEKGEELDGMVVLAKWKPFFEGLAYMASVEGEPRSMLYHPRRKVETWKFLPTGGASFWPLVLETDSPEVGEELLRRYYEQVDSGMQEKVLPSSRAGRQRAQDAKLSATGAELEAACNISTLAIDWSTVEHGLMSKHSMSGECARDVRTAVAFCESYPNAKKRVEAISKVSCDFSRYSTTKTSELVIDGNELVYYVGSTGVDYANELATLRASFGEMDQVFEGAKGTLIFRHGPQNTIYYELDKRFYPIGGPSGSGDPYGRVPVARGIRRAYFGRHRGVWYLRCGDESLPLTRVVGEKRERLLAEAVYEKEAKWKREPYFLARDTRGVYYYVDRYRKEFGGRHYRVFVGKRGALSLTKLKGLVEDSVGTVFSTQKGELRLIVTPKASAMWIRGNTRSELTAVDPDRNRSLIYDELGVYFGENLGHVCDE